APILRKMAATAREALVDAAAEKWGVDRSSIAVANGSVRNGGSAKTASFGELAAAVDWVHTAGKQDCVTPAPKWQVAGTSVPKVNAREMGGKTGTNLSTRSVFLYQGEQRNAGHP